jgi:hypothetical protein
MGFSVDSNQYGNAIDYKFDASYSYVVRNDVNYAIGYSKIKSAVYQDITDDNWALVILQSTAEPKDPTIPQGIFNIPTSYDGTTYYQNTYSDIDNSSIAWGYSAYITSANYFMEQPSPRDEPDSNYYTASTELGDETKVSGSITFVDDELNLYFDHSASDNIFDVDFVYSSSGLDSSYINVDEYNLSE